MSKWKYDPLDIYGRGVDDPNEIPPISEDEKDLLQRFEEQKDVAYNSRVARERQWDFFRYYLQGELLARDSVTSDIYRVQTDEVRRQTLVQDNICRPVSRAFIGKHIRSIPTASVRPASGDREDMIAAEVLDGYIDYFEQKESMRVKYKRLIDFLPWAGTSLIQPVWDPQAGRDIHWCDECGYYAEYDEESEVCPQCKLEFEVQIEHKKQAFIQEQREAGYTPDPEEINELVSELGDPPERELVKFKEGDIKAKIIDPRDFFPDPGATEVEDMEWYYIRRPRQINVLRQMFPEMATTITPEQDIYRDRSISFSGSLLSAYTDTKYLENHAYYYEYHEKPSVVYPKGRLIWFSSERVLKRHTNSEGEEENPYLDLDGNFQIFPFRTDRRPGEFWGEPPMEQAWPLQRERNKLITQMSIHRELTNNPKVFSPANNGVNVDYLDTTPGQVIKYKKVQGPPEYGKLPPFPNYVYNEVGRLEAAIMSKFGVTQQEMGISTGDPSGRYAAILEAQSTEAINPILVENNDQMMKFYRAVLLLAQKYYHPSRKWAIHGQDKVQTYSWDRVVIRDGWDVSIREGDSLSRNPALRRQDALNFLNQGAYNDPVTGVPDLKRFWRHAGVIDVRAGYDEEANERTYAAAIPEMLARGIEVTPQPEDLAEVMAEELRGWLAGPGRSGADPKVKEQIRQLFMQYTQTVQQQQAAMMAQQQGQQGQGAPIPTNPVDGVPQEPTSASQHIQTADRSAEGQARMTMGQEN
jgi:hypothetical protein